MTSLSAALETIMAGAAWPQARVGDTFHDQPTFCSLCGESRADSLHVNGDCPHMNSMQDPSIQMPNKLIPKANREAGDMPCYWLRGLMPLALGHIPEDQKNYHDKYY